jgi:hypothetical protein
MDLKFFSKMTTKFSQTTRHNIPDYSNFHGYRHVILETHIKTLCTDSYVVESGGQANTLCFKGINYGVILLTPINVEHSLIM